MIWGHAPNDAPKQTKSPQMLANAIDLKQFLNQQLTSTSELLRTAGDQTNQLDIEPEKTG